jgi:DNA adenine methylase
MVPKREAVQRPALRYHGGKWQLAPWITSHFPRHRVYTEPFGGAGSVLLRKPRAYSEVYNDLDGQVVNFFRVLRDPEQASRLAELLVLTPFAREEWLAAYEPSTDPVERARRTIVRSQMGFGSDSVKANRKTGFRSNTSRRGTTPALDWSRYPREIAGLTERLQGVMIDQKPAIEVLAEHDGPSTLHYLDPPYPHSVRSEVRGYSHEMTDEDHRQLATVVRGLAGHIVISGYRCPLYDKLYEGWERVDRAVIVFRATRRTESLWLSPRTVVALDQQSFFGQMPEKA